MSLILGLGGAWLTLSQGSIIPNFFQRLNKAVIYNACYNGEAKEGKHHSFVLGLKNVLTKFDVPLDTFTFFRTIPDDAWGLSNTSVSASNFFVWRSLMISIAVGVA
jgi:hypothetical protein